MENVLKVGDRVKLRAGVIKDYVKHMVKYYSLAVDKDPTDRMIPLANANEIHFWLEHFLKRTRPEGVITRYGCKEDKVGDNRKYVYVELEHNGDTVKSYFSEHYLIKLKEPHDRDTRDSDSRASTRDNNKTVQRPATRKARAGSKSAEVRKPLRRRIPSVPVRKKQSRI